MRKEPSRVQLSLAAPSIMFLDVELYLRKGEQSYDAYAWLRRNEAETEPQGRHDRTAVNSRPQFIYSYARHTDPSLILPTYGYRATSQRARLRVFARGDLSISLFSKATTRTVFSPEHGLCDSDRHVRPERRDLQLINVKHI